MNQLLLLAVLLTPVAQGDPLLQDLESRDFYKIRAAALALQRLGRANEAIRPIGREMSKGKLGDFNLRNSWAPVFLFERNDKVADNYIVECWIRFGFWEGPAEQMLFRDEKRFLHLLVRMLDVKVKTKTETLSMISHITLRDKKYEWVIRRYANDKDPELRKAVKVELVDLHKNRPSYLEQLKRNPPVLEKIEDITMF